MLAELVYDQHICPGFQTRRNKTHRRLKRGEGKNFEISRKSAGIGVLTVVVALLLGLGGYLVGKNGGEDLGQARAEGSKAGNKIGAVKGSTAGYAVGLKQGEKTGYQSSFGPAYKNAYAAAMVDAGLDRPKLQSIQLPGE